MQTKRIISAITAAAILATAVSMPTWAEDTAGIDSDSNLAINAANFPDETFRTYISDNFDSNSDEVLSQEEREAVTGIYVDNSEGANPNIESVAGIEYFPNLTSLSCCGNIITELDVSANTKLEYLWCDDNQLSSLDLSAQTALVDLTADNNRRWIALNPEDNTFDLSTLPQDFDISKTSNWSDNCSVSGTTLTVTSGTDVTYDYDAGNGYTITFTLTLGIEQPAVYGGTWNYPATELGTAELVDASDENSWYDLFIGDVSSLKEIGENKSILVYVSDVNEKGYFRFAGNNSECNWVESGINDNITELAAYDAETGIITVPYSVWSEFAEAVFQGGNGCTFYGICFEDDTDTIAEIEALMEANNSDENNSDEEMTEYTYTLNDDDTLTITKYNGSDANVVIPSAIDGKKVTVIGEDAFIGKTVITSVTIPEGVTTIMSHAFRSCHSLSSVTLPSTLTLMGVENYDWSGSEGYCFHDCPNLTSITFKNGNVTIGGSFMFGMYDVEIDESTSTLKYIPWFTVYGPANSKLQSYLELMYAKPIGEQYRSCLYASTDTVYAGSIDVPATSDSFTGKHIASEGVWYNLAIVDGTSSAITAHKNNDMLIYLTVESSEYAYFKIGGNVDGEWDTENTVENEVVELTDYYDEDLDCITIPYSVWGKYDEIYIQGGYGCTFYGICFEDDTDTIAEIESLMGTETPDETTTKPSPIIVPITTTTTEATTVPEETTASDATTVPEETTASDATTVPEESAVEIESEGKSVEEIAEEVADAAEDGENIVVKADENVFENAAEIIDQIKGKDVDLTLEGDGYSWSVNGKDIDESLPHIDLNVIFRTENIPEHKVHDKLDEHHGKPHETFQFTIKHNGKFGFEAILTFIVDDKHAGKITNIYYYNEETKEFELITSAEVGKNGEVKAPMKHASDYLVVIEDEAAAEGESTAETEGDNENSNPATGVSLAATAVFAAVMGSTAMAASKKRKK